ncbi:MBL fold metallo-hydrolase [Paenibacillus sp. GCM10023252]|uniref:MBL fold metallo-hydrolase n=1 Tax=Paenibacillus sp. GCM10023252 TaxID=3252649 RepID=UPI00361E6CDF
MAMNGKVIRSLLRDYMKRNTNRRPSALISMDTPQLDHIPADGAVVSWFGHSAFFLQLGGQKLLIDPMLGKAPSPLPIFGSSRYSGKPPIEVSQLPQIDAVLISHDHYDHLDAGTIKGLKNKVKRFFVPIGVAARLVKWGISPDHIQELNWWEETTYEGLKLACTPARHFSGRGLFDRDSTLWCSWVIEGGDTKVFYSGDSGYDDHFREIGERYGPFDLTLMECGQYDERWSAIHMMPEETVQAHIDVNGRILIPVHWGAFTLALHTWTDPIDRAIRAAAGREVLVATPRIGQLMNINGTEYPSEAWWRASVDERLRGHTSNSMNPRRYNRE